MLLWSSGSIFTSNLSEAERQGSLVRILRSLLFIFLYLFHYCFSFLFHSIIYYNYNYFFLYAFLIMIFPLLVSGVRVGRLCWVRQEPAVLAAVG